MISVEDLQKAGELLLEADNIEAWGSPEDQLRVMKLANLQEAAAVASLGFLQQGIIDEFTRDGERAEEVREFVLKHTPMLMAWLTSSVMIGVTAGVLAVRMGQGEVGEIWKS